MADGYTLTGSALRRIGEQTRKGELQRTDLRDKQQSKKRPPGNVARFRLLTPLEFGRTAAGRMLSLEPLDGGKLDWVQQDREEVLFAATSDQTRWDVGAEVTALSTPGGWAVVTEALMALVSAKSHLIPYAVVPVGSEASGYPGILHIGGGGGGTQPWEQDYAFLGNVPDDPPLQEREPSGKVNAKLWPCTARTPTWAAYALAADTSLPAEVLEALGWTNNTHPTPGEIWGTNLGPRLQRTAHVLPLYWWRFNPPDWTCITVDDPDSADPNDTIDVWGRNGVPHPSMTPCTEDPPDNPAVYQIIPDGWWGWGWGLFGWTGWGLGLGYPSWWFGNSFNYWWGSWGFGWWDRWWGGRPPSEIDLPEPDDPVPDPGGGWTVERLCVYGFIVWEWGWRILGVDTTRQLAHIIGDIEFHSKVVVVHATPDECPDDYGY